MRRGRLADGSAGTGRCVAVIVGGSHSDRPLVHACQAAGYRVVTVGGDPNGLGHRGAEVVHIVDYSEPDLVIETLKEYDPDLVLAGANDFAALTANAVGHALGLPGLDTPAMCEVFHRKDLFRRLAPDAAVPIPRQYGPDSRSIVLPVVVKPVDLTGGKGVEVVTARQDLPAAWHRARCRSRVDRAVVEQFIAGSHHGVSSIIVGRRVRFIFFDDEFYRPGVFEVAAACSPTSLPIRIQHEVTEAIERMAAVWRMADGIVHLQLVADETAWSVIDTCRRIPGDHYPDLVRLASGVGYLDGLVALSRGEDWFPAVRPSTRSVIRICLAAPAAGTFLSVQFNNDQRDLRLEHIFDVVPTGSMVAEGQKVAIALLSGPPGHRWRSIEEAETTLIVRVDQAGYEARG